MAEAASGLAKQRLNLCQRLGLDGHPGRSGEAMRALWLKQRHGMPAQVGLASP